MATHDYNIANQGFPAFRADLNNALSAIVSNNSSATEPATTFAYQWWMDTAADPSILKVRNADNDAWITLGTFNQTADTFTPAGVTSDKIEEGNSKVEVVDTGTGHILFQVDGAEVARFNPDQLVTKAGTASTPAVSPTGDLNTGIFFPAADTIAFAKGGAEAVRIDSDGDVAIGATSVSSDYFSDRILQLTGPNSAAIKFERTSATARKWEVGLTTGGNLDFVDIVASTSVPRARLDTSGNLLVGTTSAMIDGVGIQVGEVGVDGVSGFGMTSVISIADDATITLSANTAILVFIEYYQDPVDGNVYPGAMFFCSYAGTVQLVSNSGGQFAAADTDGKACVFKSINTDTVTVKNRLGSTKNYSIHTLHLRGQ